MSKQSDLIKSLIRRTNQLKAGWKETADDKVFLLPFPQYSILFSEEASTMQNTEEPDYVIRIVNKEGTIVEEIRDWDENLKDAFQPASEYAYPVMRDFYRNVRRQAMGLDEAYNYLLKELNDA